MQRNLAVLVSLAICLAASTRPTRPHHFYLISGLESGSPIGPISFYPTDHLLRALSNLSLHLADSSYFRCIHFIETHGSAMVRSRQAESESVAQVRICRLCSQPVPVSVLQSPACAAHSVSCLPPPPLCAKYQPARPGLSPVSAPDTEAGLCWARAAPVSSLKPGRAVRAEAEQTQASTAVTYLPSSPSQTTAKSFTQHSKF